MKLDKSIERLSTWIKILKERRDYYNRQIRYKGYNAYGCNKAYAKANLPKVLAELKEFEYSVKILKDKNKSIEKHECVKEKNQKNLWYVPCKICGRILP